MKKAIENHDKARINRRIGDWYSCVSIDPSKIIPGPHGCHRCPGTGEIMYKITE